MLILEPISMFGFMGSSEVHAVRVRHIVIIIRCVNRILEVNNIQTDTR